MTRPKILTLGAGSAGVFFASKLAAAGAETAVAARSDYAAAAAHGYEIDDRGKVSRFIPDHLIRGAAHCPFTPDYVLIAAKVLPEITIEELTRNLPYDASTVFVLIQNGIGIEEEAARAFPRNEILSAAAYLCAARPEPGKVVNTGPGRLEMGSFPAGVPSEPARLLAQLFATGGAPCTLLDNVQYARWRKLLWNVPYNPLSVLAGGVDTAWLCGRAELDELCLDLMREVIAIARSAGIELKYEEAVAMRDYTRTLKPYASSMLQDYRAHRGLEVEAILGNPLRIAARNGVPAPKMATCYALLKSLDALRAAKR